MDEEPLAGGVANTGAVARVGDAVHRPASPYSGAIHRFLEHLQENGFDGPRPLGFDEQGREILTFIPGEVPVPPHPAWSLTDEVLAGIGRLLRSYHDAASTFEFENDEWSDELRDPVGAEVVCHNDVCLENIVFRVGEPRAFLDFDFAAPGRRIWDVAMTASMCAPLKPKGYDARPDTDPVERLTIFARAYGVARHESEELVNAIVETAHVGKAFVKRHVEAGHPGFIEMVAGRPPDVVEKHFEWLYGIRDAFYERLNRELAA